MNAHDKYDTKKRSTLRLIITALASLLLLGSVGCDEARLVDSNYQQSEEPDEETSEDSGVDHADNDHQSLDEHGHGSTEEERVLNAPGYMNGSWRAAAGESDAPAVYFDTFQDKGDTEVSGTFLMGFAIYERYDGESGEVETASFDGETLTVLWNPTTDREEMLTLQATRVDENTMEGTVTAKRNVEMNIPVTLTRRTIK